MQSYIRAHALGVFYLSEDDCCQMEMNSVEQETHPKFLEMSSGVTLKVIMKSQTRSATETG